MRAGVHGEFPRNPPVFATLAGELQNREWRIHTGNSIVIPVRMSSGPVLLRKTTIMAH